MTRAQFLTVRWNNILALGLPALLYVIVAFATPLWMAQGGMIGLALIGVLY